MTAELSELNRDHGFFLVQLRVLRGRPPAFLIDSRSGDPEIARVDLDACRERFKTYLGQHDLRMTGQRMAIFDAVFGQDTHFTAEELLEKARAIDESVSRATVYRTLPIMIESGLMREVDIGKNLKFYMSADPDEPGEQAQVICVDCDKIFEIPAPFMEWYGSTVSGRLGLTPVSQRLQVSATCNKFRASGKCENRR